MQNKDGQQNLNISNVILICDFDIKTKLLNTNGYANMAKLALTIGGNDEFRKNEYQ